MVVSNRTDQVEAGSILAFATVRDEALRLPRFLEHHRRIGVSHFLIVDNGSTDGTSRFLEDQPDVSLWRTDASYRAARFGMDWINHLLARHGSGHWCLTLDADELFDFPHSDTRTLRDLIGWLEEQGRDTYGTLMLDLFPKGSPGQQTYVAGDDPLEAIPWFDPSGYRRAIQPRLNALVIEGGVRPRVFFPGDPSRAPTLTKTPLVRWHWRYAYVNATHSLLPRRLNDHQRMGNGILLHTKFLPDAPARARREKIRGEHFGLPDRFSDYYDALAADPDLWSEGAVRYRDWRSAESAGLLSRGGWD